MSKRWLMGGVAMAGVAWIAVVAVLRLQEPAQAQDKPAVTLEFAPHEVVVPQPARMPAVVEFSGPLVAPGTAVVRSKASGTLLALSVAEGQRVAAGQPVGRPWWWRPSR